MVSTAVPYKGPHICSRPFRKDQSGEMQLNTLRPAAAYFVPAGPGFLTPGPAGLHAICRCYFDSFGAAGCTGETGGMPASGSSAP